MRLTKAKVTYAPARLWAGMVYLGLTLSSTVLGDPTGTLSHIYSTGTGETRRFQLEGGSWVELNTRTRLEQLYEGERLVLLHEGEAYFEVTPDPNRPFRVKVGQSEIRVLGTRFDVHAKPNGHIAVTVLEGAVRVEGRNEGATEPAWNRELYANQRIEYGADGLIRDTCTLPTAANAIKWRTGVIEFADADLAEVIEELQRYTDQRIVIADERLKQVRLQVALSTRDLRASLSRLAKIAPLIVKEKDGQFILTMRNARAR